MPTIVIRRGCFMTSPFSSRLSHGHAAHVHPLPHSTRTSQSASGVLSERATRWASTGTTLKRPRNSPVRFRFFVLSAPVGQTRSHGPGGPERRRILVSNLLVPGDNLLRPA